MLCERRDTEMVSITAVIPFCSYDRLFFKPCIDNLLSCGIKCIIVVYDHLWQGEPENTALLQECRLLYENNPNVEHILLHWSEGKASSHWESYGRYIATTRVHTQYVLYIDVDEIVEPELFKRWLFTGKYKKYVGMKLRNYSYAVMPNYRLKVNAYNTVMCRTSYATSLGFTGKLRLQFVNNANRWSRWLTKLGLSKLFYIYRGEPFIHHYTAARSKENMIKKVTNWSHHIDRPNWKELVIEGRKIKNGRISGHKFEVVDNFFNLEL